MNMDKELIGLLNKNYGINIVSVKTIERLMFRQSFLVQTINKNRYVVKSYSCNYSIKELTLIWQYYWKLRNLGVEVGCPIRKINSKEFHLCIGDKYYVVFEYIEGLRPNTNQGKEIADCLRKYHEVASAGLLPELISTKQKIDRVEEQFEFFYYDDYILKQEILSCERNMHEIVASYSGSGLTVIHGDTILENMVWNHNNVCLIDFDNIRCGDAIEDVANTVLSLIYYDSKEFKIHSERAGEVDFFLDCYYRNSYPLDIKEKIHYYMKVHCIVELVRYAENIKYLIRMPTMKEYLLLLIKVINSKSFEMLIQEDNRNV